MSQVLYRKYRPEKLADVVGQDHIVKTLQAALKNGRLSHAYLFTGPRGVGKTSVARILAYEANGMKYGDRSAGLDIIEIDGASNRRIEEIRDLRDKVHMTPVAGKYKVYIIDEVHMLTKEAFNALLKTLEEPPEHCIFILATTEAHKLPETIVSRTQRFAFKPITDESIAEHLASLAKKEKIKIDSEGLRIIAAHGQGSFRDSMSLLDQLRPTGDKIDADFIRSYLGLPPAEQVQNIFNALLDGDISALSKAIGDLKIAASNPALTARAIGETVRESIKNTKAEAWQITLLKELLEVAASPMPQERLEIALFEAASHKSSASLSRVEQTATISQPVKQPSQPSEPATPKIKSASKTSFTQRDWHQLIAKVKAAQPAAALALKHGLPEFDKDKFRIIFEFPLYKNKLNRAVYRDLIGQVLSDELGIDKPVELVVDKARFKKSQKPAVQTITNIFGGGEVLESSVNI